MSAAEPARNAPERKAAGASRDKGGALRDPVVRRMVYVALALVILFLATVTGALLSGVGRPDHPRTTAERDLLVAAESVKSGAVGAAWAPYITALVATGDLGKARITLDAARASVPATMTVPELELSEARIELAQERYPQAERAAGTAMKAFEAEQAARVASAETSKAASEVGIDTAYYDAALIRAYGYVGMRRSKEAIPLFDLYIKHKPTAADVLVDRGNAKADAKDEKGAEKDFKAALQFVPYDSEAKAGLKRIGAAR
jgi:tetratricopeptide (TPR) repeat protein